MDAQTFQTRFGTSPQEVQAKLVTRAWKDEAFKQRLLGEPRTAIREEAGIDLPSDFDVRVVEITPAYLPVVVPQPSQDHAGRPLDDIVVLLTAGTADQPDEIREAIRKQARLLALAWTDTAFRSDLEARPKQVIERELGVQIPAGVQVEILSDTSGRGHLVLPPDPNVSADELTDEQLEAVAGGVTPTVLIFAVTVTVSVVLGTVAWTANNGGW